MPEFFSISACLNALAGAFKPSSRALQLRGLIINSYLKKEVADYIEKDQMFYNMIIEQCKGFEQKWLIRLLDSCTIEKDLYSIGYQPMDNVKAN